MWKIIAKLEEQDFVVNPIWEVRDGPSGEFVRPVALDSIPEVQGKVYLAATEFIAANGVRFSGYCSPADPSGLDYTQPVIFGDAGPVALWSDQSGVSTREVAASLGFSEDDVFPLNIRCLIVGPEGQYSEEVGFGSNGD